MVRALQQGRGYRRGENAYVNQNESFATRAQALPAADEFRIAPLLTGLHPSAANITNGQYFIYLGYFEQSIRVAEARMATVTGAAGTWEAQIYVLNVQEGTLRRQPGTHVTFDTSPSGLLKEQVSGILPARQRFFVGIQVNSGANAGVARSFLGTQLSLQELYTNTVTTGLPGTLALSTSSRAAVTQFPIVEYFSRDAAKVM